MAKCSVGYFVDSLAAGTAVGQQHLRSILAFCNSPLMNSIEAYIQFTPGARQRKSVRG